MNMVNPRIIEVLDVSKAPYEIHDHSSYATTIKSPADFSKAVGLPLNQITKSLFLKQSDGKYAVVVAAMSKQIDFKRVAELLTVPRVEFGKPDELDRITGYPRNGVSPLGLPSDIPILLDSDLLAHPTVSIGGGAIGVEVELSPKLLVSLAGARVHSITE